MFGWDERRRLAETVESQSLAIRELRAGVERLLRERDDAVEKFKIANEALAEARSRLKAPDARAAIRRLRGE